MKHERFEQLMNQLERIRMAILEIRPAEQWHPTTTKADWETPTTGTPLPPQPATTSGSRYSTGLDPRGIRYDVWDSQAKKYCYSGSEEDCEQWIADQKPKLPESVDELGDRCFAPLRVPDEAYGAFSAMNCLYILRDAYWQAENWEPDWDEIEQVKYSIYLRKGKPNMGTSYITNTFLVFPTVDQAAHFLKHHRSLIEQARELL